MGKFDELDEEEKLRRKNEEIAYRNKKRNSNVLLFFGTIFEIIETLIIVIALFLLSAAIFSRVLSGEIFGRVYNYVSLAAFIGGILIGFKIYKTLMQFIINKYNLREKLTEEVLRHYDKETQEKYEEKMKKRR